MARSTISESMPTIALRDQPVCLPWSGGPRLGRRLRSAAKRRNRRLSGDSRLKVVGDPRGVVSDPQARYFGRRVEERFLVPFGEARLGRIGLDEWLRRSQ